MNNRFFSAVCAAAASMLLIIALLIVSIEMFAINQGFFESEYSKLETAQSIGISEQDLTEVTHKLINYTTDADSNLDIQAEIGGEMQEVFGEREKDHMVDVKALYLAARNVRTYCLVGAVALIIIAFLIAKGQALKTLCKAFLYVSGVFVLIVGALGIYAAVDFTSFWVSFHHLFFTNDLWLLDPATDVLIMMVPQQFFSDLVARIIIRFVSIFVALNAAAAAGLIVIRKRKKNVQEA